MSRIVVLIIIPDEQYELEICRKKLLTWSTSLSSLAAVEVDNRKIDKKLAKTRSLLAEQQPTPVDDGGGGDTTMVKIVQKCLDALCIVDHSWVRSKNGHHYQIMFSVSLADSDMVLQYFKSNGIGRRLDTSIGLISYTYFQYDDCLRKLIQPSSSPVEEVTTDDNSHTPDENDLPDWLHRKVPSKKVSKKKKFLQSITARLTVAQVVDQVRDSADFSFNFLIYIITATCLTAMSLFENSDYLVVASMLLCPMLGPLMALTFGTIIHDWSLVRLGLRNILLGLSTSIVCGFLYGMAVLNLAPHWRCPFPRGEHWKWPTDSMRAQGLTRALWDGALVAFPSGCTIAIALLSGDQFPLVGVAISVSLLPPCVNSGLLWAYGTIQYIHSIGEPKVEYISSNANGNGTTTIKLLKRSLFPDKDYQVVYNDNIAIECAYLGLMSVAFSLINFVTIYIGGCLLLRIKEVIPLSKLSPKTERFFAQDIPIVREYNINRTTTKTISSVKELSEDLLREWTELNKTNNNNDNSDNIQTLANITKKVINNDHIYRSITSKKNDKSKRKTLETFSKLFNRDLNCDQ